MFYQWHLVKVVVLLFLENSTSQKEINVFYVMNHGWKSVNFQLIKISRKLTKVCRKKDFSIIFSINRESWKLLQRKFRPTFWSPERWTEIIVVFKNDQTFRPIWVVGNLNQIKKIPVARKFFYQSLNCFF